MIRHALVPGSDEWHAFRFDHDGSSEAASMLGISKLTTRNELLRMKSSGTAKEFSDWVQKNILDYGHEVEALTRQIIESRIGEELSPITCSDGRISASCDGLTFDGSISWEHKQANKSLIESIKAGFLPDEHFPQCQQNLLVTGAEKLIFSVGDGSLENTFSMWVLPSEMWFERIRAGWVQFNKDRESYVHEEAIPVAIATPIRDLPAITYKMEGLSLTTNLQADVKPAILALVEQAKKPLENDQDFADLDALCKKFKLAEEQCAMVADQAVGEIKDVAAFGRDLKELQEIMAAARIAGTKRVSSEKESRKLKIISDAKHEFINHVNALYEETKPIEIMVKQPDFALGIKGMAKLDNIKGKCNDMVAEGKIAADAAAKDIRAKLAWCKENAAGHNALFPDLQALMSKPMEDFALTITSRIEKQKADEAARMEAERVKIQAEEEAKARTKVAAEHAALVVEPQALQPVHVSTVYTPNGGRGSTIISTPISYIPSRIQLIEAIASTFKLTYSIAEKYLVEEFTQKKE